MSDMLDVLHYFYEDDLDFSTIEQLKWSESSRQQIYRDMYKSTYKYVSQSSTKDFGSYEEDEEIIPFDPVKKNETKPYVPPTAMSGDLDNPFGDILDKPL